MVVTSGQFLIDSEANLKADLQRIQMPTNNNKLPQINDINLHDKKGTNQ